MHTTQNSYEENPNSYLTSTKQMQYEQRTQKEEHSFLLQCKDKDHEHEKELLDKNLGFVGQFFGSAEHASKNITATICLVLVLGITIISCFIYFLEKDVAFVKSMWHCISPIITLSLGYLFGKK